LLFVRIHVPVDIKIGSAASPPEPRVDVLGRLLEELARPGNTGVAAAPSRAAELVVMRPPTTPNAAPALQPDGTIKVRQGVVPLAVRIQRFGAGRPLDKCLFRIEGARVEGADGLEVAGERPTADFAPATYFDLTEDEKLSRRAFEAHPAGVYLGGKGMPYFTGVAPGDFSYEAHLVDRTKPRLKFADLHRFGPEVLDSLLRSNAAALSAAKRAAVAEPPVRAKKERFVVVGIEDLAPKIKAEFGSHQGALEALAGLAAQNPSMHGLLRVASTLELAA
jgi:hypothetical protein